VLAAVSPLDVKLKNLEENLVSVESPKENTVKKIKRKETGDLVVVLVAMYQYQNFPIRIMQPLLEKIDNVTTYTIFFKHSSTNTFIPPSEIEKELFAKTIADLDPDLVGISVLTLHEGIAKNLTEIVRANSSALVAWGGVHPTIDPEACIQVADILCVGEGEGAITDLVTKMRDGENYDDVENLWVNADGQIKKNPMRPLIQDLDSLPFPSYGNDSFIFINDEKISSVDHSVADQLLWIQGSRGCPFVCSFCVNSVTQPLFKGTGKYRRVRSVKNIIDEINEQIGILEKMNLPREWKNTVFFVDEVFGDINNEEWLTEFESTYPKEVGLPFFIETLPMENLINNQILDQLDNSGVKVIQFGIQTGSDNHRKNIFHRPTKNKDIIRIANEIAARGITVKTDIIGDSPYDTEETLKETIQLIFQLPKPLDFNYYRMQYFPDYPFTQKAIEDGFITEEDTKSEALLVKTETEWSFIPRLKLRDKKSILGNIVWLLVHGHTRDGFVRYAVFNDSIGSKIGLQFLNLQAYIYGKIFGVGGLVWRYVWVKRVFAIFRYLSRGDINGLITKVMSVIKGTKITKNFADFNRAGQSSKSRSLLAGLERNET
jgi:anaerobic magnesium-protoporphyrin IX monomethyl ester cyclase